MTEIVLQTNDDQKLLAFDAIACDGADYTCRLRVTSHGFSCERPFYFSRSYLKRFCDALKQLDRTLLGDAELRHEYEDDIIRVTGDGLGHLEVSGTIVGNGEQHQQLDFSFVTDQTCLRTLIPDLESLLDGSHVA